MYVNDLRIGTKVKFQNGWEARLDDDDVGDDKRAFIVEQGFMTSHGVYPMRNVAAYMTVDGDWRTDLTWYPE